MVVAYLRGVLKPSLKYGLRSIVAENYVLESLVAGTQADLLETIVLSDSAILPALTAESKRETMRVIRRRLQRCTDIRNGNIYGVNKVQRKDQISLYQLYQLASRSGILETLTKANCTATNE
jgi:hypothetical protein